MGIINVLIVEDDPLLRSGLELVIQAEDDLCVFATARNGLEALDALRHGRPDLVLLDLQMPDMDGIAFIEEVRKQDTELPILVLTTFHEEEYIVQGLASGANGYLLKGLAFGKLVQAIRDAFSGQFMLPADVAAKVARVAWNHKSYIQGQGLNHYLGRTDTFSAAEQDIIRLLVNRYSNKEIAAELYLAEGTIKNRLTTIYEKLGAKSRQDAIRRLEALADKPGFGS